MTRGKTTSPVASNTPLKRVCPNRTPLPAKHLFKEGYELYQELKKRVATTGCCWESLSDEMEEILQIWKDASRQGHGEAENNIGLMYELGHGVQQSDSEAARWYKLASDNGIIGAKFNLGSMYEEGRGVVQSNIEAARYYRSAGEAGFAPAQASLGYMYQYGYGVPQSSANAVLWYQRAADQNCKEACFNLGLLCGYGDETLLSTSTEAVRFYLMNDCEEGIPTSKACLAELLLRGEGGLECDVPRGLRLAREASAQGSVRGAALLRQFQTSDVVNED